jgi:L-asparaginase II
MYCAALPESGLGVAIKMDDGNNARASEAVMAAVIERLLTLDDSDRAVLRGYSQATLRNWNGLEIGQLRAAQLLR